MLNESILSKDPLALQVWWYMQRTHHQGDWTTLYEVALALRIDAAGNGAVHATPHDYHKLPNIAALTQALMQHDGTFWDVRVHFYGMDDSLRLRPNVTTNTTSVPALAWKERIYTALLKRGCHHDEVSIDVSDLMLPPPLGLGLLRPLSLMSAPSPSLRSPPRPLRHVLQAQTATQAKAAEAEQRDKLLLRHILEEDPMFDLRCNNQLQRINQLAAQEMLARDKLREEICMKPSSRLPNAVFDSEWAVFLRGRPGYRLCLVGVCSRNIQGAQAARPAPLLAENRCDETVGTGTSTGTGTGTGTGTAVAAPSKAEQASSLQDLKTDSGYAACGVVLRSRRVRQLPPPAPYSDPGHATVEVDGRVWGAGMGGDQENEQCIESREDVVWEWRHFVGNNSTRQAAEYTALAKALELCARKGYMPLVVYTDTQDLATNMKRRAVDEDELRKVMADLDTKTKHQAMAKARAEAAALAHTPNPQPSIRGASLYIFEVHTQCVQYILNMQAQTQVMQHSMPEYYNILGLPSVKSQRRKNPQHTNPTIHLDAAKTLTVPLGQLLRVTGKPSEFVPWSDEMFARTAIGKYCSVPIEQAVTFTVLTAATSTLELSSRLAEAKALARRSQEDGLLIARGSFHSVPELPVSQEPADQYNSLKKSSLLKEADTELLAGEGGLHVSWLGEAKSGTAAMDTACNRGLLPGARTASEQVRDLAAAWDGKTVGTQPDESAYVKFSGQPSAPLLPTLIYDEQPAHYLRCPCEAGILNTYCDKCGN